MTTNNKELREEILDILRQPNNKMPPRYSIAEKTRHEQADKILDIIQDRITEARIEELKAISEFPKNRFRTDVWDITYFANKRIKELQAQLEKSSK